MKYIIELKKINKSYNKQILFNELDFKVKSGKIAIIKGESGIGKSTLLKSITKFNKIDSGEIIFDGKNINEYNLISLRENIGLVFQDYSLFTNMDVINNLTLALVHVKKNSKEEARSKAIVLLKRFNLEHKINSYPWELSGGESQRIAIIRALLLEPKVLLLDEPTSALDQKNKLEIISLIKQLQTQNMTIVIVSHDSDLDCIADDIYFLEGGKLRHECKKN